LLGSYEQSQAENAELKRQLAYQQVHVMALGMEAQARTNLAAMDDYAAFTQGV
jgi:hypothetical protein